MEFIEGIKTRRSIRRFTDEPVSDELITKIVDTSKMAPTWKNSQTVRYLVIKDKELKDKIANEGTNGFKHNTDIILSSNALVILLSVGKICGYNTDGTFTTSKGQGWEMFDAGIAAQTFCLTAHNYGVGSVILGLFDEVKIKEILNIDEKYNVSVLIPIGYPAAPGNNPIRKATSEILEIR